MSEPNDLAILQDMLALVDVRVTVRELERRTATERYAAEQWAGLQHLRASDNRVRVPRKPAWLPKTETEKRIAARRATP